MNELKYNSTDNKCYFYFPSDKPLVKIWLTSVTVLLAQNSLYSLHLPGKTENLELGEHNTTLYLSVCLTSECIGKHRVANLFEENLKRRQKQKTLHAFSPWARGMHYTACCAFQNICQWSLQYYLSVVSQCCIGKYRKKYPDSESCVAFVEEF